MGIQKVCEVIQLKNNELYMEIRPLQIKLLEILKYFDTFCRDNNITYYAYGGTALGAARHNGVIPWDDDVDVVMTQENFEKFLKVFSDKGDVKNFYLQVYSKILPKQIYAKLRLNGTTFIEDGYKDWKIHQGLYIDIFTLQETKESIISQVWQFICGKYILLQTYAPKKHRYRGILIECVLKVFNLMPRFFLSRFAHNQLLKNNGKKCKYYSKYTEGCSLSSGRFEKNVFGVPKELPFEGILIEVPSDIEQFLTQTYGDWMKIPSEEEIRKHIHFSTYFIDKDFKDVLKINELTDEEFL